MPDRTLPLLALTLGDPSGIGPEITMKALADSRARELARFLVVGAAEPALAARTQVTGSPELAQVGDDPATWDTPNGAVPLLSVSDAPADAFPVGQVAAASGAAAVRAVETAARLALAGHVDGIVTAPLNKEAMQKAGYRYPGHTEILGEVCGKPASMLLVSPKLRVVHVSVHVSLEEAIRRVTRANVRKAIETAHAAGRQLGYARPRIAVAGLNPHAGEGGMFGRQDEDEIRPAVEEARAAGMDVTGPLPGDTVFLRASRGEWDLVVAMYHDQGHIAVKLFGLEGGVNVTVGLPIIRTSVDHGTAFDIAGKGIAQYESMLEAIRVAVQMVAARRAGL